MCRVQKSGEIELSNADQRRRRGKVYASLSARVVGQAVLGSETRASGNTLTLGWRSPPAADPDAGKPTKKPKLKTRPQGCK